MRSMKKDLIAKLKGKMPKKAEEEKSPLDMEIDIDADEGDGALASPGSYKPGQHMGKKGPMEMEEEDIPMDMEDSEAPEASDLSHLSDDEILSEMKKRGLGAEPAGDELAEDESDMSALA